MKLSIVIPTLDEADHVARAVRSAPPGAEVLVADGGSSDDTRAVAERAGARVVAGATGRAAQMNAGARAASGEVFLFLHADAVLHPEAGPAVERALSDERVAGGSFRLRIEPGGLALSIVAFGSNLRARTLRFPYGDQALFVRRRCFERVGGFPEIPFLEDVAMVRAIRRTGRLVALDVPVTTGPRHWQELGPLRTSLLNWSTVLLYLCGASPERLARRYRRRRSEAGPRSEPRGRLVKAAGPTQPD